MNNKEYIENLERIISTIIQPIKNIPFNVVIRCLTQNSANVLDFDKSNTTHQKCLEYLKSIGEKVLLKTKTSPIVSSRPNEAGNKIENIVKEVADNIENISVTKPESSKNKSVGYPDFEIVVDNQSFYLECKTYNKKTIYSSNRSFFQSPSMDFKVTKSTVHFLISFELSSDNNKYTAVSFKILSIEKMECDLKHEFNSSNKKMYSNSNGVNILYSSGESN
jgi:hypothetical protein